MTDKIIKIANYKNCYRWHYRIRRSLIIATALQWKFVKWC